MSMVTPLRRNPYSLILLGVVLGIAFPYFARHLLILATLHEWYKNSENGFLEVSIWASFAALLGTLWALQLARKHERGLRSLEVDLQSLKGDLASLRDNLSTLVQKLGTRLIGKFPEHLSDIALLIENTEPGDAIEILADCADYGSFFAPKKHAAVQHALGATKDRGVIVRVRIGGYLHHITHNSPYYERKFEHLLNDPEFQKHLEEFLACARADDQFIEWIKRHVENVEATTDFQEWLKEFRDRDHRTGDLAVGDLTRAEVSELFLVCLDSCMGRTQLPKDGRAFALLLLARERYFELRIRNQFDVEDFSRSTKSTQLFFWMRTRHETPLDAIFMYVDAAEETRGLAFRTEERDLLRIFRNTFQSR